jgi:nitrite reductase (NADH) large subunit
VKVTSAREARPWKVAQVAGLALTALLLAGLVLRPEPTLTLFWNVAIPLVPASLLWSPLIWRNTCPLATLNLLSAGRAGTRQQTKRFQTYSSLLGIIIFYLLVPARRFLFNQDGLALAGAIVAVAILALVVGAAFDLKAGFCNAFCPLLPVERLYGQSPLLNVANDRCARCDLCSQACIDLAPEKSIARQLGASRHDSSWLRSPFGAFAAALPGFVLGYFTLNDVPLSRASEVYLHILLWAAISYLLAVAATMLLPIRNRRILRGLAALAVGLYLWFAAPGVAAAVGLPLATVPLRIASLALVVVWWFRAERGVRAVPMSVVPS